MIKKSVITVCLILLTSVVCADRVSEENRLLKSWGLKFNTQGKLKLRSVQSERKTYQPWSPDLSVYQSLQTKQPEQEVLIPLVITSRQKVEK